MTAKGKNQRKLVRNAENTLATYRKKNACQCKLGIGFDLMSSETVVGICKVTGYALQI